MWKLKAYKTTEPGLADLLRYSNLVDSGIVLTKDGALLAGYYSRPPDQDSATDEMQAIISTRANEAMMLLGTGWSMWADVISTEAADYPAPEESHFPDPISRAVDEERRQQFKAEGEHFDNERVLFLCYTPPIKSVSRLDDMVFSDDDDERKPMLPRLLAGFRKALDHFEDTIGDTIGLRRMESYKVVDLAGREHLQDELVNALNYIVTGNPDPIMVPAAACYLDSVLGAKDFHTGERPLIGSEHLCVVSVDGFPAEHLPNVMSRLTMLDMPYRFSQRAVFLDPQDAIKEINSYKRKWGQKRLGLLSSLSGNRTVTNQHAAEMYADAEAAASLAESRTVLWLWYSATVILRHASPARLEAMARKVVKAMADCGFESRIEDTNTVECWLGSMPGNPTPNLRRPLIHSQNLADWLPLSGMWTGLDRNPCPLYPPNSPPLLHAATVQGIPFRFNLHVGDVPHCLIMGPTGRGKSTLTSLIALQAWRYEKMRIWCLDNKRGMFATAKACGGKHYEVGGSGTPSFCPLGSLDTPDDLVWAQDWLEVCYQLQTKKDFTPNQRIIVYAALQDLARSGERSMTDFCLMVQDDEVRDAIRYYTLAGAGGFLLDAREDGIEDSRFNVFETKPLMDMGDDKMRLPTLLYLFRRFERSLDGNPALLFISEAWVALGNEVWKEKIQKWLRQLRSMNCGVIMDTQSLSDAYRSGILDVLIESCPTKIYLPNEEAFNRGTANTPGPRDLYEAMQLNPNQIAIIQGAKSKQQYYVTSPEGSRLITLELEPFTLAVAGATSEADVKKVRELIREYGEDGWLWQHLKNRGVDYASLLQA